MPEVERVILGIVIAWWIWLCYLLLFSPKTFVEWFLVRPYRPWGVTVTITDERKLRRQCRWVGCVFVILAIMMVYVMFTLR